MPTYDRTRRFDRDYAALTSEQKAKVKVALGKFLKDLPRGTFRKGLRVKGVQGATGVYEMTWDDNGRATFEYGDEQLADEPHIIWRRIGTHDILDAP